MATTFFSFTNESYVALLEENHNVLQVCVVLNPLVVDITFFPFGFSIDHGGVAANCINFGGGMEKHDQGRVRSI